jgi:uncharacterized CHY-type Zn-finger protein
MIPYKRYDTKGRCFHYTVINDLFISLPACQKYLKLCHIHKFEEKIVCP